MLVAMEIDIPIGYFYSLEFDRCQLSVESFVLTQTRVIISKDKTGVLIHSVGWKKGHVHIYINSCIMIYMCTVK